MPRPGIGPACAFKMRANGEHSDQIDTSSPDRLSPMLPSHRSNPVERGRGSGEPVPGTPRNYGAHLESDWNPSAGKVKNLKVLFPYLDSGVYHLFHSHGLAITLAELGHLVTAVVDHPLLLTREVVQAVG